MKKTILTTLLTSIVALGAVSAQAMKKHLSESSDSLTVSVDSLADLFARMTLDSDSAEEVPRMTHMQDLNEQLVVAAEKGKTQKVIHLISQGANVNHIDEYGWTALHLASQNGHINTVYALINVGAHINTTINIPHDSDLHGRTALSCAVENGDIETVQLLIEHHANVNLADTTDDAPLHWAARCNSSGEIIVLLLKAGADLDRCNNCDQTALDLVKERIEMKEECNNIVQILSTAYADREADREVHYIVYLAYGKERALAQEQTHFRPIKNKDKN